MIETDAYRRLLRQITAPFDTGIGRVMLADLPEDVQRGVLLMKSVIAADPALQEAAMSGWGWVDSYGPLSTLYGFREARKNGDEMTLLNPLRWGTTIMSVWEHVPEPMREMLVSEGWTAISCSTRRRSTPSRAKSRARSSSSCPTRVKTATRRS